MVESGRVVDHDALSMITSAPHLEHDHDPVEAALEASCGALITLEAIHCTAAAVGQPSGLDAHLALAARSLREAIDELRLAHSNHATGVAIGFVLDRSRP
jgi:hypothetical protein